MNVGSSLYGLWLREDIFNEIVLHVFGPAQVPCSFQIPFGELHTVETRGRPVVHSVPLHDAETCSFECICEHCKVQPKCVILGYSRGSSTLRNWNFGQSREVYRLEFLTIVHKVTICIISEKKVSASDRSEKSWAFLATEVIATPCRHVELLENR